MNSTELLYLRDKVIGGTPQIGTFIGISHPSVVEIAAFSKLDFLTLDAEHAAIGRADMENLLRAADAGGVAAMVRVPDLHGGWIGTALDAGAAGILMPLVNSAEEATAVVMACRYPPAGARGAGPGRVSRYGGDIANYMANANNKLLVAIQIETAEGLENAAEIAAVDGVDVIFIGPGDLSVSLGAFGPEGKPVLDAAIDRIVLAARAAGKKLGIFVPNAQDAPRWIDDGFTFVIVGSDVFLLHQAYAALNSAARAPIDAGQAA